MQIALILLGLAFPLLELAVLIKVGQTIGLLWTILLLVGTGIVGGAIVQRQGLSAARRAAQSMSEGRPPIEPVVDSFMLMLAGTLLLIPGLLTDALAVPLLIPPVRHWIAREALRRLFRNADIKVETRTWDGQGEGEDRRAPGHERSSGSDGPIIDAEWERVDEPRPHSHRVEDERGSGERPSDGGQPGKRQ